MRWSTGIQHTTTKQPRVTIEVKPNRDYPPEVKIDVRGGGIYLSLDEAQQLAFDLISTISTADPKGTEL